MVIATQVINEVSTVLSGMTCISMTNNFYKRIINSGKTYYWVAGITQKI